MALLAAALVFGLWYPYPYREISGGRELFFIIVAVDVVMGPLLTFAVFNRKKPLKELKRDLGVIVLLQLAALGYGLWTVFSRAACSFSLRVRPFQGGPCCGNRHRAFA